MENRVIFTKGIKVFSSIASVATALCSMTIFIVGSIHGVEQRLGDRIRAVEKDIAIIKTVLIMKDMMPRELALEEQK